MAKRKNSSVNKIATMLQATAMSKEEITSVATLGESNNIAKILETEEEIESSHKTLEEDTKKLSLDTTPIYESTAIEINKQLTAELEACKTRCAELLDEKECLQKTIEDMAKADNAPYLELSAKFAALSKDYGDLKDKYELLQEKYDREIDAYKIQLEDADRNYQLYDENESNYKIEIKKLRAEIRNLEAALEKETAQQSGAKVENSPPQVFRQDIRSGRVLPPFKKSMPSPTNGYSSWN